MSHDKRKSRQSSAGSCLNCGTPLAGRFCAACGQRADAGPLRIRALVSRVLAEVTSVDGRVVRTLRGLLLGPGRVAAEYVDGRRARYANPLKFALTTVGIAVLVATLLDTAAPVPVRVTLAGEDDLSPLMQKIAALLRGHAGMLFLLFGLPFLALGMRVAFHGKRRTTADELVLVLYTFGFAAVLQLALLAPRALVPEIAYASGPLPLVWTLWAAVRFHGTGVVSTIVRVLAAHALFVGALLAVMWVGFGVAGLFT